MLVALWPIGKDKIHFFARKSHIFNTIISAFVQSLIHCDFLFVQSVNGESDNFGIVQAGFLCDFRQLIGGEFAHSDILLCLAHAWSIA